jgi:hypothetical protein
VYGRGRATESGKVGDSLGAMGAQNGGRPAVAVVAIAALSVQSAGRAEVVDRTFGGTAICDRLDRMRTDLRDFQPSAVVLEFLLGDDDLSYGGVFSREPCGIPGPPEPVAAAPVFTG